MSQLSITPHERSRKAFATALRAMEEPGTGRNLAQVLGVSEATISRTKTEKLEDAITLLCHLGFKLVPESRVCVDRAAFEAMSTLARRAMACEQMSRQLIWDETQ